MSDRYLCFIYIACICYVIFNAFSVIYRVKITVISFEYLFKKVLTCLM